MIVIAKLKVKSGSEEQFENAVKEAMPEVEKEEGTLVYTLQRSQKDPTVYLFYEKYTGPDALTTHSSTPHFKAMSGALGPLLDGAPEFDMYDEVAGLDK
jgi:quinol monooxygenase YgiN